MKTYATIDARRDGTGDKFTKTYATEAEAVSAAERDWMYLTDREKAARTICAVVSEADEDGEFDWGNYDVIAEFTTDPGQSFVNRVGNPDTKHNPIVVWRRGDYSSVRIVSSLSYDVDEEGGEESCEIQSIAEAFGDGDGTEWWNDPMTDIEYRKLIDCTIFA